MWVNKELFQRILDDNKAQAESIAFERLGSSRMSAIEKAAREQKAKDDMTIDWMRHRINALEKQNSILMQKATGMAFPVPEIVPTRPGSMTGLPDFQSMPDFEDIGDDKAKALGLIHDEAGFVRDKAGNLISGATVA